MNNINELVYKMLTESTGSHFLDSGGESDRHWQHNRLKTLDDFNNEPQISWELSDGELLSLDDIYPTVSLYHYLTMAFELDNLTNRFNKKFNFMDNFESEWNFISDSAESWLETNGFERVSDKYNTYNYDNYLSQDVLYTELKRGDDIYYLISIHNGADIRGGYTDAKLFKLGSHIEYALSYISITGIIDGVPVTNGYDGFRLSVDNDCEIDGVTCRIDSSEFRFNRNADISLDFWL